MIKCEFVSAFVKVSQHCFIVLHSSATIETRTASVMLDMTLQKHKEKKSLFFSCHLREATWINVLNRVKNSRDAEFDD